MLKIYYSKVFKNELDLRFFYYFKSLDDIHLLIWIIYKYNILKQIKY